MALSDQDKTTFVTPTGNYHYKVMPFGLKNARATYQRMMTKMFEPQLGKNIEIYIDDVVVKSKLESKHVNDLGNIFEILRRPVFYVSKSLHEAEVRYLPLEKAILAVVYATCKLPYYFQLHTIIVLTQLPLKSLLRSADYTGRIAK